MFTKMLNLRLIEMRKAHDTITKTESKSYSNIIKYYN